MPSLTYKRSGEPDVTLPVTDKPLVIGRVSESNIVVRDSFVSRVHCGIGHADARYFLKDLGSTNGTYRNGGRVFQSELASGDRIQVGNASLIFEIDAAGNGLLRQSPAVFAPAGTPGPALKSQPPGAPPPKLAVALPKPAATAPPKLLRPS